MVAEIANICGDVTDSGDSGANVLINMVYIEDNLFRDWTIYEEATTNMLEINGRSITKDGIIHILHIFFTHWQLSKICG